MTFEEKRRLSIAIGESSPALLQRLMKIVALDPKVGQVRLCHPPLHRPCPA